MLALDLVATLVLLAICGFAPGFFLVRRLRWSPMEKLCGSVGLSLVLVYLAAWLVYIAGPADPRFAYWAVSAVCAILGALVWRDAVRLFRVPRVRKAGIGLGFLLLWTFTLLAIIRIYSGAAWAGDWLEHFQRSLFFLHRFPTDTPILGGYQLPARPPMMNVLAAFFLGQTEDRFEVFQFVFVSLNLLPFLACALMMPRLLRPRTTGIVPLVAIFAMNPAFIQNATYTWTKSLTAFYMIAALWFYLAGWKKQDPWRMTAAFLALSAGVLVHYSAGPYCVFLGLHYLAVAFRTRPNRWRELASFAVPCALLLLTWFGWSFAAYGTHTTLASNTSITSGQQFHGIAAAGKVLANFFDTVVPAAVRSPELFRVFEQPSQMAAIRDWAFMTYQVNLFFCMGVLGGPIVVWLLWKSLRRSAGAGDERNFWRILIPVIVVVGVAVVGERDPYGSAHLTILPMEFLGLVLVASAFTRRRVLATVILAACLLDCALGVFLQARVENIENSSTETYFEGIGVHRGTVTFAEPRPGGPGRLAWTNWYAKHKYTLDRQWATELARDYHAGPDLISQFHERSAETARMWRGWFERNGGQVTYFGDHFGDGELPTALFLLLWAALAWRTWSDAARISARVPSVARPASKVRPKGTARKR